MRLHGCLHKVCSRQAPDAGAFIRVRPGCEGGAQSKTWGAHEGWPAAKGWPGSLRRLLLRVRLLLQGV